MCINSKIDHPPSEFELKIHEEITEQFHSTASKNNEIYKAFENSTDPHERETLAKEIQNLEEAIIHKVAQEFNLTFDKIAIIFLKVDVYLQK